MDRPLRGEKRTYIVVALLGAIPRVRAYNGSEARERRAMYPLLFAFALAGPPSTIASSSLRTCAGRDRRKSLFNSQRDRYCDRARNPRVTLGISLRAGYPSPARKISSPDLRRFIGRLRHARGVHRSMKRSLASSARQRATRGCDGDCMPAGFA